MISQPAGWPAWPPPGCCCPASFDWANTSSYSTKCPKLPSWSSESFPGVRLVGEVAQVKNVGAWTTVSVNILITAFSSKCSHAHSHTHPYYPHPYRHPLRQIPTDNYYVECVCSPSRATFLTSMYPLHHGVTDWLEPADATGLPLNLRTLADYFKGAGYATAAVGKWHLGFFREQYSPTYRGFGE